MLGEVLNAPLLILKFSYPKASIINNLRYSKPLCSNWVLKDLIIFAHMITSCFVFDFFSKKNYSAFYNPTFFF